MYQGTRVQTGWRKAALGAGAALVLSACGSTVQWSDAVASGPGELSTDGLSADGTPGDGVGIGQPTDGRERTGGPGDSPGSADGRGGTGGPGDSRGTPGGPGDASPGAKGRGITENEIYVGYGTWKAVENVARTFGAGMDYGDQEAQAKAIVADINKRGGITGRKLKLVFYDWNFERAAQNQDAEGQIACERWTNDRPVFAVINQIAFSDKALNDCLAQRQTPHVNMALQLRPRSIYARLQPFLYAPNAPDLERFMPHWMKQLAAAGYFKGGWDADGARPGVEPAKIGVLTTKYLYPAEFRRVAREALKRQGQSVAAEYEWSGNLDSVANEMQAAILRFKEAGVTHVIASGPELNYFSTAADKQAYTPRYGLSSRNQLRLITQFAPKSHWKGALAVGWIPTIDVGNSEDPGNVSSAQARCRKLMENAGQTTSGRDTFASMVRACEGFNMLSAAIQKGNLSPAGLQQGLHKMSTMSPSSTFSISFAGGRPDGAAATRNLVSRESCQGSSNACFVYTSKNHGM